MAPPYDALSRYLPDDLHRGPHETDAVTDALREAILDGVMPPNTWLREDELAKAFNVQPHSRSGGPAPSCR